MTDDELRELEALHRTRAASGHVREHCVACSEPPPCRTVRLIAAVREARDDRADLAAKIRRRRRDVWSHGVYTPAVEREAGLWNAALEAAAKLCEEEGKKNGEKMSQLRGRFTVNVSTSRDGPIRWDLVYVTDPPDPGGAIGVLTGIPQFSEEREDAQRKIMLHIADVLNTGAGG